MTSLPVVQDDKAKESILIVQDLKKFFPIKGFLAGLTGKKKVVKAVNNISFKLFEGETYGLVGESGCGKSTTGRTILKLTEPTAGEAFYRSKDIFKISPKEFQNVRKEMQMIFQDPYSSLNPRKRIGRTLEEVLSIHSRLNRSERTEIVIDMLNRVGLRVDHYYRYPHELSGGQRQRIGIARALVVNPKIIIADEPVSALDVSVQSQILNLLQDLQRELKLTYLFISHNMSVVRHISDRIGVMYLGKIVEESSTDELFREPLHPYTKALLSAVPIPDPQKNRERIIIKGDLPSPYNPPSGCVFHTRCPYVTDICKQVEPGIKEKPGAHFVSCHLYN